MAIPEVADYPIVPEAFGVRDLLQTIKEKVASVYAANGVPLPARQYYCFGQPAHDCEQFTVSFIQSYLGMPGNQASEPLPCHSPRSAVLQISVVRKTAASGNKVAIPSAESIERAADWVAVDAWVLMDAINQFNDWGDGMPGLGVIATVETPDPSGEYQAVNLQLTVGMPN